MNKIFRYPFFTILVLITSFSSFQTFGQGMQLALDSEAWTNHSVHPVQGRTGILVKQKLSFGDYHTTQVKRSWTKGSSVVTGLTSGILTDENYQKILTNEYIKKKQALYFAVADSSSTTAEVFCVSNFNARDFNIGNSPVSVVNLFGDLLGIGGESTSLFYVEIHSKESSVPWYLVMDNQASQHSPKHYQTRLVKNQNEFYSLVPDQRVKTKKGKISNLPFGSAGYQIIDKNGNPVAAVSLIDKGVVYFTDVPNSDRIILASACMALLLQEQI